MEDTGNTEPSGTAARLLAAGFVHLGQWTSGDGLGISLDSLSDRSPGVYAYVVDDTVRYVGSAQRGLHNRFRRYVTSQTMRTSARVRGHILAVLASGKKVDVYTLVPPRLDWRGLPVDLIAGIEEGLIRQLKPAWNVRGNRSVL